MVRETNKKIMVILTVLLVSITCFFATEIAYAGDDTTISGDYEYFANEDGTNGIPVVTLTIDPEEFNKVIESKDHSYKLNMDQELTDALCMITFVEDDETVKTVEIHRDGLLSVSDLPEDPESDGLIFAGWKDSEGIAASDEYQVTQDTVFTADFVRKEESVEPNYLFFAQYDAWVDLREQTFQNIVYLLPADTQYRTITWTLSDQDPADAEIAEINKAGKVTVIQPGEVTVTATAKNGMSNSYRLHIFDSNVTPWHMPESIIPESDQLTLEVGDYGQMPITISPQPIVYDIVYYSSDKEVATVNDDGVIKALAPGTATITIYGDNNTTAQFKVIVRDTDLENPFSDVKDSDYFFNPVLWAVNHDPQITKGISSTIFSPDSTCRRCEVVTFLWRAFGAEKMTGETIFEDVETTDYFYDAAVWAVANGITNGTDETHFSPDDPCTREQVATFLWRACSRPDTVRLVSPFADVQNRESYSFTPVLWAYENGITTGTRANAFLPHDPCTRAQIVTFLFRALAEPLAPLEPDGRIHFQPKVASQYLVEVFGEEKVETWFNLVDAVMAGKDTFACPDKETYNWVMGQFPNKCFPAINPVRGLLIDYEWVFPFPVPLNFVLYRSLVLDPTWTAWPEETRRQVLAGLGITPEMEERFHRMELGLLRHISPEEDKLDYFIRTPGARDTVIYKLDELLAMPAENRRLAAEKQTYESRLWFRAMRRADRQILTPARRGIRRFARQDNLIGCACGSLVLLARKGPSAAFYHGIRPEIAKRKVRKYLRRLNREPRPAGTEASGKDAGVKFSILVPLYNTPEAFLREMIGSVRGQTYANWELCLADGSDAAHAYVGETCRRLAEEDPRIRYRKLEKNGGISENTNACIAMATGDYIALFDHDDLLHAAALEENVRAIRETGADFLYSDEMVFESPDRGKILATHFKPDFSPESLLTNNYICHLSVFKTSLLQEVGGFRKEYDGSQDIDLILRLTGRAEKVVHIPKVLYFWRSHPTSVAADVTTKPYAVEAGRRAIRDFLAASRGIEAVVESTEAFPTLYHVR